jgi:hypothetical protein
MLAEGNSCRWRKGTFTVPLQELGIYMCVYVHVNVYMYVCVMYIYICV